MDRKQNSIIAIFFRHLIIISFILLPGLASMGQNLVPNGDFELYNNCPGSVNDIPFSPFYNLFPVLNAWVAPTRGTPDYFNVCRLGSINNQQPHSGNGYVGFIIKPAGGIQTSYIEYVTCKLSTALIPGKTYELGFYASTAGTGAIALEELGANVSVTMPSASQTTALTIPYTVRNQPNLFMTDTVKWYHISATFAASGGEEWLTIGCFNNSPLSVPVSSNPTGQGYSFIDDVYLVALTEQVFVHDSLVCDTTRTRQFVSSASNADSYLWSTGDATNTMTNRNTGTFWCVATQKDTITRDTFHIRYEPLPGPIVHDTSICVNTVSPRLNVPNGLLWYTTLDGKSGTPVYPVIDTRKEDTITLYVAAAEDNCLSEKVRLQVYIVSPPSVTLGKDIALCKDAPDTTICAFIAHPSSTYSWNTGDHMPCIKVGAGEYIIQAKNLCGVATDTIQVKQYNCNNCIFIPTAFTPNGDSRNDLFRPIFNCPMTKYKLSIYNRWGQMVYTSSSVGEGWNGLMSGRPVDAGSYMYIVLSENAVTGTRYEEKGDVLLIH